MCHLRVRGAARPWHGLAGCMCARRAVVAPQPPAQRPAACAALQRRTADGARAAHAGRCVTPTQNQGRRHARTWPGRNSRERGHANLGRQTSCPLRAQLIVDFPHSDGYFRRHPSSTTLLLTACKFRARLGYFPLVPPMPGWSSLAVSGGQSSGKNQECWRVRSHSFWNAAKRGTGIWPHLSQVLRGCVAPAHLGIVSLGGRCAAVGQPAVPARQRRQTRLASVPTASVPCARVRRPGNAGLGPSRSWPRSPVWWSANLSPTRPCMSGRVLDLTVSRNHAQVRLGVRLRRGTPRLPDHARPGGQAEGGRGCCWSGPSTKAGGIRAPARGKTVWAVLGGCIDGRAGHRR